MTFEEHWQRLQLANPQMRDAIVMTMPMDEFRRQLERAYRRGFEEGQEVAPSDDPIGSLFEMFGKLRKD